MGQKESTEQIKRRRKRVKQVCNHEPNWLMDDLKELGWYNKPTSPSNPLTK